MRRQRLAMMVLTTGLFGLAALALPAWAQNADGSDDTAESAPADSAPAADEAEAGANAVPLSTRQEGLTRRYKDFETTLLQMYEYMRKTDPEKADLLVRAIGRSKDARIAQQMDQLAATLEQRKYGSAVERQEELIVQLRGMLELLQSEDRFKALEEEKARIKDLVKEVGKLIGKEMDVRAKTERGEDPEKLTERQQGVAGDAKRLVEKIDGQDAKRNAEGDSSPGEGKPSEGESGEGEPKEGQPGEAKPGESKPGEGKPGEGKPDEKKPEDGKPGESKPGEEKPGEAKPGEGKPSAGQPGEAKPGESKPGESKPGESQPGQGQPSQGQPSEGQPSEGQPSEGQPSEGQPGENQPQESSQNPNRTPGRDDIEQARQEMEHAIEELKKANRKGASEHQDEAIAKLRKAKEKLEEILRQLREEERELLLAALEARFQKMLALQLMVYNGTISLDKTPKAEWTSRHVGRVRELSQQEDAIALEAEKALALLKGEGSSIAFPEAVEMLRDDMRTVARRLEREEVDELTQGIEKDIIDALEEMIEALQKEMEKARDQKNKPPGEGGQPSDPALVDKLAELKMLRSLQFRVNRRTKQISRMVEDGEQATKPDLIAELQKLSRRQARIQETAYGLATGRNQ